MKTRKSLFTLLLLIAVAAAVPLAAQYHNASQSQARAYLNNGLAITLSTNMDRYEPAQPIDISVVLYNDSNSPMNYQFVNSPICDFWITSSGKEIWRYSKTQSFSGTQVLQLEPRRSKICSTVWNQTDSSGNRVRPGWYDIYTKFSAADSGQEPLHLRIRIDESTYSGSGSPVMLTVPINSGTIDTRRDVGKTISIEGTLRQGPQGLYVEVRDVKVGR